MHWCNFSGMGGVEVVALIIALVAFLVALLQVMQQYGSSAVSGKVNAAAIGAWSRKNRLRWSGWEWKFHCEYRRPHLTSKIALDILLNYSSRQALRAAALGPFTSAESISFSESCDGLMLEGRPTLVIYREDDREQRREIPINNLPWVSRRAARALQRGLERMYARPMPCRASWCQLAEDIGLHLDDIPSDDFLDAGAIPSALDAPLMEMRLSDLVRLGFLLHMEVMNIDERKHLIDMTSQHCYITTHDVEGVGNVVRYSGTAGGVQPMTRLATFGELSILLSTASGRIQVGDSRGPISYWGYNSVEKVLAAAMEKSSGSKWEEIDITETMSDLVEGDSHPLWNGHWSDPTVPVIAFLLSLCSNMAVANSFPHHFLQWAPNLRHSACVTAFDLIDETVGFIDAPSNLFRIIREKDFSIFHGNNYKSASNYGCEHGGLRGWLSTNLAEFTYRVSECWNVSGITDNVPILAQLRSVVKEGGIDREWCEKYDAMASFLHADHGNEKSDFNRVRVSDDNSGPGWSMSANSLLWMQITMLDTWIGRRIDIMTGSVLEEVAVPSDRKQASACQRSALNLKQTTAWKASRMKFARQYLVRLAEGASGGAGRRAVSCMASGLTNPEPSLGQPSWSDMPFGMAHDWAAIDAVLTLRSILMFARLERMNDSSILIRLQKFDPVVRLV